MLTVSHITNFIQVFSSVTIKHFHTSAIKKPICPQFCSEFLLLDFLPCCFKCILHSSGQYQDNKWTFYVAARQTISLATLTLRVDKTFCALFTPLHFHKYCRLWFSSQHEECPMWWLLTPPSQCSLAVHTFQAAGKINLKYWKFVTAPWDFIASKFQSYLLWAFIFTTPISICTDSITSKSHMTQPRIS